jgi:hypothetical protein
MVERLPLPQRRFRVDCVNNYIQGVTIYSLGDKLGQV